MTPDTYTAWQEETVDELTPLVGVVTACRLLGRSRATHHRRAHPGPRMHGPWAKPHHPGQLSVPEREQVLAVLTSQEYANDSPTQVWAQELDQGRYWCSARTMYRILAGAGMSGERRRQATHPPRAIPELVAICPNQVWSWDIPPQAGGAPSKMRGPSKGVWCHAYVVIDIFSRYVVGWRIEAVEDGHLAADLVTDIVAEQGRPPGYLHADGGAAMTSQPLASLLVDLDVARSHNRPRTSNDNPFSESQFTTMKYVPDYPDRFTTIGAARTWMSGFTSWYNHEHRHSGIGLHTPASAHYGTTDQIQHARQQTLDGAYAKQPQRFHRRPQAPTLPERVTINESHWV